MKMKYLFKIELDIDFELQQKLVNYCEIHETTMQEAIKYILNAWLYEYDFEWIQK